MIEIIFKLSKAEVVLFDAINKEIVINSILKGCDYFVLETRGKALVLNYHVLYQLVLQSVEIIKKKNFLDILREVKKRYFLSIIDIIDPSVIVTYIDNDPYFHEICRLRKDIIGIGIQNGVRTHYNYHDRLNSEKRHKYCIPYYFVHGNHAESVYKKYNHQSKEIFVVGSIKLDYFNSKNKAEYNQHQLCLISTWTGSEVIYGDYPFSTENQYKALLQIRDVVIKCGYNLVIALKTELDVEVAFYRSIFHDNATYQINGNDEFSSYNICYNSKVILTTYSTLGFELFSIGKNVIFFNLSTDTKYTHSHGNTIISTNRKQLIHLIDQMLHSKPKYKYKSIENIQCIHNEKPSFEIIREFIDKMVRS